MAFFSLRSLARDEYGCRRFPSPSWPTPSTNTCPTKTPPAPSRAAWLAALSVPSWTESNSLLSPLPFGIEPKVGHPTLDTVNTVFRNSFDNGILSGGVHHGIVV